MSRAVEPCPGFASSSGARALRRGDVVETRQTDRAALRLVDGAQLRLDHESRLTLQCRRRFRFEAGAFYFDSDPSAVERGAGASSSKMARNEIRVDTPFASLRNLGTRYQARLFDDRLEVAVHLGRVEVFVDGSRRWTVERGERLSVDAEGQPTWDVAPPFGDLWQWTLELSPPFATEGRSLDEFLAWVERESGMEIRFLTDRRVGRIRLAGDLV